MQTIKLIKLNAIEQERITRIYWGKIPLPLGHEAKGVVFKHLDGGNMPVSAAGVWTKAQGRNWTLAGGVVRAI